MTVGKMAISGLAITNSGLSPATIDFLPGLNMVVGASNTGKTFIFETLDFMLGGKDALRTIAESRGYTKIELFMHLESRGAVTLQRAFEGGHFQLREYANGRTAPPTRSIPLSSLHGPDPNGSLSAYMLAALGIGSVEVRKNDRGEKQSLSFRNICQFALIDEERIIQKSSPVLSKHPFAKTVDRNVFAFLLTGTDDAAITTIDSPQEQRTRLAAEEDLLESLLAAKRDELAKLSPDPSDLSEQANRLDTAIQAAVAIVTSSQDEAHVIEKQRAPLFERRAHTHSKIRALDEQLKKLRLLDDYYKSDRERLQAVIEASQVFHDLPEGSCPLCNRPYATTSDVPHSDFEEACALEVRKIEALRHDLNATIADYSQEAEKAGKEYSSVDQELRDLDARLRLIIMPRAETARVDLNVLLSNKTRITQSSALDAAIRELETRVARVRFARLAKPTRGSFQNRATTSTTTEFCEVVREILDAWKYPGLRTVSFDTKKSDLVINGQDRANAGKGYRALTYAAFAVGLMKYCGRKNLPHPGFVVLDTPLNPYKGPSAPASNEKITDDMKVAFVEHLSADTSGDQVIVLENEEPHVAKKGPVKYHRFTKNSESGRYGFFPMIRG